MTNTQHTPAPWMAVAATDPAFKTIMQRPYSAAGQLESVSPEVRIAEHVRPNDARLIAAAPEQHEYLTDMLLAYSDETTDEQWEALGAKYCDDDCYNVDIIRERIKSNARAAIAKAKGE